MANSSSAKKRIRQNRKRTLRNRVRKERLRKALRAFQATVQEGDAAKVQEGLQKATKAVDWAGNKGLIHANAVSRKKAQLAQAANTVLRPASAAAPEGESAPATA